MTRDMELIRKIFAEIQKWDHANLNYVEIPGVDEAVVARHLEMLLRAELIEGIISDPMDQPFPSIKVKDLSWSGHDFASALANDGVWKKIRETFPAAELKKMPLSVIAEVAKGLLMKFAMSKAGLG